MVGWKTLVVLTPCSAALGRTDRCTLVNTGVHWYKLVYTGTNWYTLMYTDINWYTLVYTGILVYRILQYLEQ